MSGPRLALLVAVTMVAFAANSLLNRMALTGADTGPLVFAALRLVAGAAMLRLLLGGRGGHGRLIRALSLPKAAALATYMLGFSLAYRSLDAGLGALILFGGVQLTMFAGALIGGERTTPLKLAGAGLAFSGLVYILWPSGPVEIAPLAAASMLAAALGWGLFSLMGRGGSDPLAATSAAFTLAALPVLVVALVFWDGITWPGALLATVSGAVTSGLGYALWYRLLPHLPASNAAVAQLTVPPIAIAGGAMVLGELPSWSFLIGSVVILGGVLLSVLAPKPQRT